MTARSRIDAAELEDVRLSSDGQRLILLLRDADGQQTALSLPAGWLSRVFTAAPRPIRQGTVHALNAWRMTQADNGQDLVLTLSTADGLTASFQMKPWQAEGMATVVAYGRTRPAASGSIH
jgi:hypothetical protein